MTEDTITENPITITHNSEWGDLAWEAHQEQEVKGDIIYGWGPTAAAALEDMEDQIAMRQ